MLPTLGVGQPHLLDEDLDALQQLVLVQADEVHAGVLEQACKQRLNACRFVLLARVIHHNIHLCHICLGAARVGLQRIISSPRRRHATLNISGVIKVPETGAELHSIAQTHNRNTECSRYWTRSVSIKMSAASCISLSWLLALLRRA